MEGGGGVHPNLPPGMMGLEMQQIQHHQQQQQQQQQQHQQRQRQQQFLPFSSSQQQQQQPQTHHESTAQKPYSMTTNKLQPKQHQQSLPPPPPYHQQQLSPDEHPGHLPVASPASSVSPWQRMKWTDEMVRLLIMVVYYVGDETGTDHPSSSGEATASGTKTTTSNKKNNVGGPHHLQSTQQQKKGKWKSVSKAMMERGHCVSPQQCEDKFNDLNKRYKRVNDILGRGTACKVVENQKLLDTMEKLSPKAKEEARKLLNSKHLFFREMCAYHSTCAANAATGQIAGNPGVGGSVMPIHHQPCESGPALQFAHPQPSTTVMQKRATGGYGDDEHHQRDMIMEDEEEEEEEEEEEDYDDDEEEDEDGGLQSRRPLHGLEVNGEEEHESKTGFAAATTTFSGTKRQRRSCSPPQTPPSSHQLQSELLGLNGTVEQQRQWVQQRAVELEERKVGYQRRALDLEKQRFKWQRYSRNKEREMEKRKLNNDRLHLESERMLLLLRRKELEILTCKCNESGNYAAISTTGTAVPEQHPQPQQGGVVSTTPFLV